VHQIPIKCGHGEGNTITSFRESCDLEQTSVMINDRRSMADIIYYTGTKRSNMEIR
jgi:hypothetical protein